MKNFTVEIKWAVLFALALLAWMFMEKSLGWHDVHIDKQPIYTIIFALIAILLYVLALKEKKRTIFNGQIDWKQGFISGILLTVFITILSPLTQYITYAIISPDYFKNAIQYSVLHKIMTQQAANEYYTLKSFIMQGVFDALSRGVVTSAIVAYFIKSK
nr:DUF4199 domain-containing protein [uncultured Flavobacterium sp.]